MLVGLDGCEVRLCDPCACVRDRWWRHVPSLGLAPLVLRQRPRLLDDDSSSDSEAS